MLFLYAGILYLFGIAIILLTKPSLMFSENGNWKEFGIGKNNDKYTWFPFWLFSIFWAIVAYALVLFISMKWKQHSCTLETQETYETIESQPPPRKIRRRRQNIPSSELKPGYYMLNTKNQNQKQNKIPKYVYIGPDVTHTQPTNQMLQSDQKAPPT